MTFNDGKAKSRPQGKLRRSQITINDAKQITFNDGEAK